MKIFNFTSRVLTYELYGNSTKLPAFVHVLKLIQVNREGNEENAVAIMRTNLAKKDRNIIQDKNWKLCPGLPRGTRKIYKNRKRKNFSLHI